MVTRKKAGEGAKQRSSLQYTSKIIKAGALIGDTKTLLSHWVSDDSVDENIERLQRDNVFGKASRSRVDDILAIFKQRYLADELVTKSLVTLATVVVAARNAWPEYNEFHAYVCQPNRGFRQVTRMGFYSKGLIYPLIPKIEEVRDDVVMEKNLHKGRVGELVNFLLERSLRLVDQRYKVFLLSAPDSSDTIKLAAAIPNDKRDKSGKGTAFTMGQRYVAISDLLSAKSTSELDAD